MSTEDRKIAIICSKGGLDEAYPALILANAARASGIDCMMFFTFYGLDVITERKVDHLHVNMAGNPSSPMPTMVAGLPGMESFAASMMLKQMKELDLPVPGEKTSGGPAKTQDQKHEACSRRADSNDALKIEGQVRDGAEDAHGSQGGYCSGSCEQTQTKKIERNDRFSSPPLEPEEQCEDRHGCSNDRDRFRIQWLD